MYASIHLSTQTHHLSPGLRPGNEYSFLGVIKSFPLFFGKIKKFFDQL